LTAGLNLRRPNPWHEPSVQREPGAFHEQDHILVLELERRAGPIASSRSRQARTAVQVKKTSNRNSGPGGLDLERTTHPAVPPFRSAPQSRCRAPGKEQQTDSTAKSRGHWKGDRDSRGSYRGSPEIRSAASRLRAAAAGEMHAGMAGSGREEEVTRIGGALKPKKVNAPGAWGVFGGGFIYRNAPGFRGVSCTEAVNRWW
jgi:hypothetical protein